MALIDLPVEIQQRIIFYLPSIKDLAALSTQCRALHSLCDMNQRRKYGQVRVSSDTGHLDASFDVLMDILRRPSVGYYVSHLEYRAKVPLGVDYCEKEHQRQITASDMQLLCRATGRAGFTGAQEKQVINMLLRRTDARYSKEDNAETYLAQALAALLISVSPNLCSMAMAPTSFRDANCEFPLDWLLRQVNEQLHDKLYLQNLRTVYIINESDELPGYEREYARMDFLRCLKVIKDLPSIELVGTDLLEEDRNGEKELEPRSANFSRVVIHHSWVSSRYIIKLVRSCRILREFQYSIGGRFPNWHNPDRDHSGFILNALMRVMIIHRDTLEVLDMDLESHIYPFGYYSSDATRQQGFNQDESQYGDNELEPDSPLRKLEGSLKDFSAMKKLSLSISVLMYWAKGVNGDVSMKGTLVDNLPPRLEYLCVRGYKRGEFPDYDTHIDSLLESMRQGLIGLKEVYGVDQVIPHALDVHWPDQQPYLLWKGRDDDFRLMSGMPMD
ncbi:hypothetical protein BJX99DRAFT_12492 [Aspergillus californicus]